MKKSRYIYKFAFVVTVVTMLAAVSAYSKPVVRFVDSGRAAALVLPDGEPCVSRLPAWELSISEGTYHRFSPQKAGEDCGKEFKAALRDFTDEEKATLLRYASLVDSVISADFPALGAIPWNFAVISDSTDFGIPVSSTHIVLTRSLIGDMDEWMESQSRMLFVGMEILVYEKVRLLQIARPTPFEKFYREAWGFRRIAPLSIDRIMQDNGFYFTQVPPNEWVIKTGKKEFIMPALLLRDAGGKDGGGTAQRVAVTIDSTSKGFFPRKSKRMPIEYRDLRFIPQYRRTFPLSDYDYHPSELAADLIAKYLVIKYVSGRFGTAPAKVSDYSQVDVLMNMVK